MELVTWRGTPGVGDFMWALNSAHNYCYNYNTKVNLEFHWEHDENHLHHFEDPETIIERLNYIHNFYHRKDDVKVTHVYNADSRYSKSWKWSDDLVKENDGSIRIAAIQRANKTRFWFESGVYSDEKGGKAPKSDWPFREDILNRKIDSRKVVIWTPVFNAEKPRTWKRLLTSDQWRDTISLLRKAGLNIIEVDYRTPVSEVLYHISTCRQIVCYDGMWHYIGRNCATPMVVISPEGITRYHTPQCIRTTNSSDDERNIAMWLRNIPEMLGESKKRAVNYEQSLRNFIESD